MGRQSLSHPVVHSRVVRSAQAAQVLCCICSTLCQRHTVMHQRRLDVSSFCHAHFAKRLAFQLRGSYTMLFSVVVSFLVCWVTEEGVVVVVCFFPMLFAVLAIGQVGAARMLAGFHGFSGHFSTSRQ